MGVEPGFPMLWPLSYEDTLEEKTSHQSPKVWITSIPYLSLPGWSYMFFKQKNLKR